MGTEKITFSYNKLRGRVIEKYGTIREFANDYGISENSMSQKFNNKMRFTADDIISMSKMLDIGKDEIGIYFFNTGV